MSLRRSLLLCTVGVLTFSLCACHALPPPKPEQWILEREELAECDAERLIQLKGERTVCKDKPAAGQGPAPQPVSAAKPAPRRRDAIYAPEESGDASPVLSARLNGVSPLLLARLLSVATGGEVIAAPTLEGGVYGRFDGATRRHVLQSLAALHGWVLLRQDRAVLIRKATGADAKRRDTLTTRSELLHLRHMEPKAFSDIVARLFPDDNAAPLVVVDPRKRAVVVKGDKETVERVYRIAEKIDVPVRQVFIEAFIIEAGEDFERRLGSRLGYDLNRDNLRIAGVVRPPGDGGQALGERGGALVDLPVPDAVGGIGFLIDRRRLKLELTAMEREGTTRIISNPRVFTLDSERATVFQGDEVPYLSVSDEGTQTQFREAGVKLEVTPKVIGNGRLMIRVSVNKDSVDTRQANPSITRRSIETSLIVADGAMAVIGGIYFNTQVESVVGLPWLRDVPLLGVLFRNSDRRSDARELLVLLLPTVV